MDFLDPKKQKRHNVRLMIGYVLIGLVLILATVILLYQAFGFGINRQGQLIQNGLVFIGSTPEGAQVVVNGKEQRNATNTRLVLPAGQYVFEIKRNGYRDWKRAITVEGGTVQRFDYPFLFPVQLEPTAVQQIPGGPPAFLSQSDNSRWVVMGAATANNFELWDLANDQPRNSTFAVPAEVLSANTTTTGWQSVAWAGDNRRFLLLRQFERNGQPGSEYILFDRENAAAAVNLSITLGFTPSQIVFRNGDYDRYYAFDGANGALFTASLGQPTPQLILEHVLSFAAEGNDLILYATNHNAPADKTLIELRDGATNYTVRQVAADAGPVLVAMAQYEGQLYIAAGASKESRTYVYRDPLSTLKKAGQPLVPVHILKTDQPDFLTFAPDERFVMAENKGKFAVYDAETDRGYAYDLGVNITSTSGRATWMDPFRLSLTVDGNLYVFDYDGTNRQTLLPVASSLLPAFSEDYRSLYTVNATGEFQRTPLRTQN